MTLQTLVENQLVTSAKKYILSKLRISRILCPVNPYLSIGHDRDRIDHCDVTMILHTYLTVSVYVYIKYFESIIPIIVANEIMQLVIVVVIEIGKT